MPKKALVYLDPIVITPTDTHRTTIIVLHGRGSTAEKFASPLLNHTVASLATSASPPKSFRVYFRQTKFVFPTAPLRRAVVFNRSLTHQWFDNWSITQPKLKQHLQIPGLRETSTYLHELLRKEISIVGSQNVVLMGLSQGCAASLVSTMLWNGDALGAVVGMCGYLPLRMPMAEFAGGYEDGGEEEAFAQSGFEEEDVFIREDLGPEITNHPSETKLERAVAWLREELEMNEDQSGNAAVPGIQAIPVFMGYGREDEKVPTDITRSASEFLSSMGVTVEQKEYDGLGHWYSENMLRDVIEFLKRLQGWEDIIDED